MTKRNVMIRILSSRLEVPRELFEEDTLPEDFEIDSLSGEMPDPSEMMMEGRLITGSDRVEVVYEESELTGMEGSVTSVGFARNAPELISMMRTGLVRTALVFEEGKRHLCLYNTPFSQMEICVHALRVENELLTTGRILLDYLIEIHGLQAEHCHMEIFVRSAEEL